MLEQSDVISFHNYRPLPGMRADVETLKRYGRPLLCTEYMAQPADSRFDPILAYLKSEHVGAPTTGASSPARPDDLSWDSWQKPYHDEPTVWFHDIFRAERHAIQLDRGWLHPRRDRGGEVSPAISRKPAGSMTREICPLTINDLSDLGRF